MEIKSHSYDDVYKASLEYFNGDELAARVWSSKYALKDSFGHIFELTPNDMHHRIASEIARIESNYPNPMSEQQIFDLIKNFKYIVPQGSPMSGIGNNYQVGSLSNCFVIGIDGEPDSYGGIIKIDEEQVQLMKRRGGVGHDLSHIRPKGSPVKNSALTSTGLVPFMQRYSNSTREVAQDGRRGALMLSVSIKHPDSEAFIDAKMEQGMVTGANVSVRIDDEFMNAAISGSKYTQQYPIEGEATYTCEIEASTLWAKIVHNAWKSAEPGVLFWDTIIRESVPDCYADLGFKTISTNPCGEIPLCPYPTNIAFAGSSGSAGEANNVGESAAAEAIQKAVGDNAGIFSIAIMHSKVALNLAKQQLLQFRKYTDAAGIERIINIADWNGLTVIVDDGVPVATNAKDTAAKDYTTYLMGAGAIQFAEAPVDTPVETSRTVLEAGGYNLLATRLRETLHPNGFSYTLPQSSGSNVSSPTDAQLGTTTQWSIVADPKQIAMARIISNG